MRAPKASECAGLPAAPAGTVRTCPDRAALVADLPGAGQLLANTSDAEMPCSGGRRWWAWPCPKRPQVWRTPPSCPASSARAHGRHWRPYLPLLRAQTTQMLGSLHGPYGPCAPLFCLLACFACVLSCPCSTQKPACIFAHPARLCLAAPTCWPMCCSLSCLPVQMTPSTLSLLSSVEAASRTYSSSVPLA